MTDFNKFVIADVVLSPSRKYFVLEFVLQKSRQLICGIIKTRFLAILAFSLKNTWIFTPTRLFQCSDNSIQKSDF